MSKDIIKAIIGEKNFEHVKYARKIYKKNDFENKKNIIECYRNTMIIKKEINKGVQIKRLCEKLDIGEVNLNSRFYYYIDEFKQLYNQNIVIANFAIDYDKVLKCSLSEYKNLFVDSDDEFSKNELETINGIEILINRTIKKIGDHQVKKEIIDSLNGIMDRKANGFRDALQRILFFNQIMWQTGHVLNGLGRLDLILEKYYENDIASNIMSKKDAAELINDFLVNIHRFYKFKSNSLIGDTGQVIILGGKHNERGYICNDLTYLFIDAIKQLNYPDPKILLRVSEKMPRKLMEKALECIQTGLGCPLLANDDIIVNRLIDFGIKEDDAYNYGTSACWEPIIIGKSISQNNVFTLNLLQPLEKIFEEDRNLEELDSTDKIIKKYKDFLKDEIEMIGEKINNLKFEKNPILSLFIDDAVKRKKDVSMGGAVYNNYGILTVGMANTINSILNIEDFVFKTKKIDLNTFNEKRKRNYSEEQDLIKELKNNKRKYGVDREDVINLTNDIFVYISNILKDISKKYDKCIKIGLSSPAYIDQGKLTNASFDGRKNGEPLSVHISSDNSNAYTELIQFASKIDYNENRINGNVIDFLVTPNIIQDNFEKFVDFLLLSIKNGFYEMQLNVVSSDMLIEAKKYPDKFPNLIVRVWGFSAYFNDLPQDYKNYLIERALKNEGKNY